MTAPPDWSVSSPSLSSSDIGVDVDAHAAASSTGESPGSSSTDSSTSVSTEVTTRAGVGGSTVDSTVDSTIDSADELVVLLLEQSDPFVSLLSSVLVLPTSKDDLATGVTVTEGRSPAAAANDLNSLHSKLYPPLRLLLLLLPLLLAILVVVTCLSGWAAGSETSSGGGSIALSSMRKRVGTKREIPSSSRMSPANQQHVARQRAVQHPTSNATSRPITVPHVSGDGGEGDEAHLDKSCTHMIVVRWVKSAVRRIYKQVHNRRATAPVSQYTTLSSCKPASSKRTHARH